MRGEAGCVRAGVCKVCMCEGCYLHDDGTGRVGVARQLP